MAVTFAIAVRTFKNSNYISGAYCIEALEAIAIALCKESWYVRLYLLAYVHLQPAARDQMALTHYLSKIKNTGCISC